MKKNLTYSDKLKDPRWQKIRLEVFNRDHFMCMDCGDKKNMLAVHHRYYTKGAEPWEYPSECFVTLCDKCHKQRHEHRSTCETNLLTALKEKGAEYCELQMLSQAIYNAARFSDFFDLIRPLLSQGEIDEHCNPIPQPLIKTIDIGSDS